MLLYCLFCNTYIYHIFVLFQDNHNKTDVRFQINLNTGFSVFIKFYCTLCNNLKKVLPKCIRIHYLTNFKFGYNNFIEILFMTFTFSPELVSEAAMELIINEEKNGALLQVVNGESSYFNLSQREDHSIP